MKDEGVGAHGVGGWRISAFTTRLSPFPRPRRRRGFTLVELLMVLAIVAVVSAVTMPAFFKSMKGNRLRAAARTVVMAGRYARSMCLLNQKELLLQFDLKNATVAVIPVDPKPAAPGGGGAGDLRAPAGWSGLDPGPSEDAQPFDAGDAPPAAARPDIFRALDEVQIDSVQVGEEDAAFPAGAADGEVVYVIYRSNGTCTPYRVRIVDDNGGATTVQVDMLGGVETESR